MSVTKVDVAEPELRRVEAIDPALVRENASGMCWRELLVRLPKSAVMADLSDPQLWTRVQRSVYSLRRGDKLRIVDFLESFALETIVAGASDKSVTLSKITRYDMQPRLEAIAGDENYAIQWTGSGFGVFRRTDGHQVSPTVATVPLAEKELRNQYGSQAA